MWNYLCLLENHFWQVPLPLISKMCKVVNFQSLNEVHFKKFFEEEFVEVEKWKAEISTNITCKTIEWGICYCTHFIF